MSVPILKLGDFLIASAQAELLDTDWEELRRELLEKSGRLRSKGAIVDISVMDVLDSFAARTLRDTVHALRLRGSECVIVGIQPDVAFAMAQLGLRLEGVTTALDLEEGMETLRQKISPRSAHAG
jgi:rsbT antagonist protein RsbS